MEATLSFCGVQNQLRRYVFLLGEKQEEGTGQAGYNLLLPLTLCTESENSGSHLPGFALNEQ